MKQEKNYLQTDWTRDIMIRVEFKLSLQFLMPCGDLEYNLFQKNCTSILVPRDAYHEWGKNNTEIQKTAEQNNS